MLHLNGYHSLSSSRVLNAFLLSDSRRLREVGGFLLVPGSTRGQLDLKASVRLGLEPVVHCLLSIVEGPEFNSNTVPLRENSHPALLPSESLLPDLAISKGHELNLGCL